MKKRKSGLADTPFFNRQVGDPTVSETRQASVDEPVIPRHHDTMTPRNRDTVVSQGDEMTEIIRRAVKELGKEAATHRFTVAEKQALAEIIYASKQRQINTSENEITRIAINFIIQDYRQHGNASILIQVLDKLNA